MTSMLLIGATALLGFYMAWNIGANDVANSMADAVGSRSISIRNAVWAAGICEFAGAVLVGSHVSETIRKGIVSPESLSSSPDVLGTGMACALLAAAMWLHFATWFGMPVSTTHSIVGAIAGFGVVAVGWSAIEWGTMAKIVSSWFISPVAGAAMAFVMFKLIVWMILGREKPTLAAVRVAPFIIFFVTSVMALAVFYKGLKHVSGASEWLTGSRAFFISIGLGIVGALVSKRILLRDLQNRYGEPLSAQLEYVERVFSPLVVFTSCCVAFSHGANDVANAIGPLAAVTDIAKSGSVASEVPVPLWILTLGGIGIVVGLATYGYRVMQTVGLRITQLTPSRGIAADVAAMTTVLVCSRLKLPVSTTHTLVGAILGVGLARGLASVDRRVTQHIFGSWLITVPAAAGLAMVLFLLAQLFLPL